MGAKAIMLANPYTYKFLKGLTHSALLEVLFHSMEVKKVKGKQGHLWLSEIIYFGWYIFYK